MGKRTIQQEKLPAQKRYHTTEAGKARLKKVLLLPSEVPVVRNDFLLRLGWTECLSTGEVEGIIDEYRRSLEKELSMCQENLRRERKKEHCSRRESNTWVMLHRNREMALLAELKWLALLRGGLAGRTGAEQ